MIFALWYGGASYSPGSVETDLEVFESVDAASSATFERFQFGDSRTQDFTAPDGKVTSTFCPVVDMDSVMDIYLTDPRGSSDPYPDARIAWDQTLEDFLEVPC